MLVERLFVSRSRMRCCLERMCGCVCVVLIIIIICPRCSPFCNNKNKIIIIIIIIIIIMIIIIIITKNRLHNAVYKITKDVGHNLWHAQTALIRYTRGPAE